MDDFDLTERLITAAEFASMLGVTEDDVLEWVLAGHVPCVEGPDGEPRVRVAERHAVDGPVSSGFAGYSMSGDPAFRAERARRRRDLELATLDWGDVNVEALADALAIRLRAVVPSPVRVVAEGATVLLGDADGLGIGIDIAFHASFPEDVQDRTSLTLSPHRTTPAPEPASRHPDVSQSSIDRAVAAFVSVA